MSVLLPILKLTHLAFLNSSFDFFFFFSHSTALALINPTASVKDDVLPDTHTHTHVDFRQWMEEGMDSLPQ